MPYYLFNWFLHFGYGVVVCGLGVFFIFLSNGKFDDVASWLYSSRNFLLLTIKILAFLTTYKVLGFYKKGMETFDQKISKVTCFNLGIFFLLALILKLFISNTGLFSINSLFHLISLFFDFSLFLLLRKYYKEFNRVDLTLISFTQVVVYFVIYQEGFYLSFVAMGFFYFLYQSLNRWNNIHMVYLSALSGLFIFVESTQPKQEMFLYFISLLLSFSLYMGIKSRFPKKNKLIEEA